MGEKMIRWPYKFRKPEGVKKGIPGLRALWYKWDVFVENLYIRCTSLPKQCLYCGPERNEKIVVSLTSFPARINKVYYAIKSLMIQTEKADEIRLFLAEEQFPKKYLPKKLQKLVDRGLNIIWTDDKRSHKKYYYSLQGQRGNELVITYDDDIIYEKDSIEKLIKAHRCFPDCIICNRGQEILRTDDGVMKPYNQWRLNSKIGVYEPTMDVMPSTGGGCLYPYGAVPSITFDWELARKNALTADDLWMRFCSYSRGTKVVKTRQTIATLCIVTGSQKEKLADINTVNGENQRVIERLADLFPSVYKIEEE